MKNRARRENKDRKHFTFSENDLVLVKAQNQSNASDKKIAKFFHVYEGPYIVKRKVNMNTYLVADGNNNERGKFHISNLKPYYVEE